MRASLTQFQQGLEDLKHYIKGIEIESRILGLDISSCAQSQATVIVNDFKDHYDSLTTKRRFEYNTIIISLYGYLEQFVEGLLVAYLNYLNSVVPSYGELPEAIPRYHVELSFDLLRRSDHSRYQGTIKKELVISNLNSCLIIPSVGYKLNIEAYAHHVSNVRQDVIDEMFAKCGVNGLSHLIRDEKRMKAYLIETHGARDVSRLASNELFPVLTDLASRRNEVAHGTVNELLSNDILLSYIDFLSSYGGALYDVILEQSMPFAVKYRSVNLGIPITVLNNSVVCLTLPAYSGVALGDLLVAETPAKRFLVGPIKEMQIDRQALIRVQALQPLQIGLRVEYHAKSNQRFYILKRGN